MILAGIDPSLSATAVVLSDPSAGPEGFKLRIFGSKPQGDEVSARFGRFTELARRIGNYLRENRVTVMYLEGYSHNSKFNVTLLAEFGAMLRCNLLDIGQVVEVAPSILKKFATGKGNAEKDIVAASIVKQWNVMLDNTDAFDAYAAWRFGRCCQAIDEPRNDAQREAVAKVMGLPAPKVKKPRTKPTPKPF